MVLLAVAEPATATSKKQDVTVECLNSVHQVYRHRGATRAYEHKMGHNPSRSNFNASKVKSCAYVRWVAQFWSYMEQKRQSEYQHWLKQQQEVSSPNWLVNAFLCIHKYEGSWTDAGDPYWGGLQFGPNEWHTYGGMFAPTANLATPAQQIQAGINYYHVSGFSPWPKTARACGLL